MPGDETRQVIIEEAQEAVRKAAESSNFLAVLPWGKIIQGGMIALGLGGAGFGATQHREVTAVQDTCRDAREDERDQCHKLIRTCVEQIADGRSN